MDASALRANTGAKRGRLRRGLRGSVLQFGRMRAFWNGRSLAVQFLLAGGLVSLAAMVFVGLLVTQLIESSVTRNSAATTARYVDSVIAPLLPDMRKNEVLADPAKRALDETLGQGALGRRLRSFRLWRRDGTVLYGMERAPLGERQPLGDSLRQAFAGRLVADFVASDEAAGEPLLKIYNPVLQPWTGEVVAVSEFQEYAADFEHDLVRARILSWLAVALATLAFFLGLSAIVLRGSRVIDRQRRALGERVAELSDLLAQNETLRLRVQRASQRTAALNERHLRRIGADLHDGPAQLLALAALKLDSSALTAASQTRSAREREVRAIKAVLQEAMREIRSVCRGLVLPQVEAAELPEVLRLAVDTHAQRTGTPVSLSMAPAPPPVSASGKICIYRFVQEALNNSYRHGKGAGQSVRQTADGGRIIVEVADAGPGFDPEHVRPDGLGLAGLRERVESLGGDFEVSSSPRGTRVRISLDAVEMEASP